MPTYHNMQVPSRGPLTRSRALSVEVINRIENVRLGRRWTYQHVADLIGIHYSTLYLALHGNKLHATTAATIEKFAEGLHV